MHIKHLIISTLKLHSLHVRCKDYVFSLHSWYMLFLPIVFGWSIFSLYYQQYAMGLYRTGFILKHYSRLPWYALVSQGEAKLFGCRAFNHYSTNIMELMDALNWGLDILLCLVSRIHFAFLLWFLCKCV